MHINKQSDALFGGDILLLNMLFFCKITDYLMVWLPWLTKIVNILSFFIHDICKPDMGYIDTIYVVHIQLCCKKIIRFENGQILVF